MIKRLFAFTLSLIIVIQVSTATIIAEEVVEVYLNNELVEYNDFYGHPFIDENDRTQVPFRVTLETFGATVEWDGENEIARAIKDGITVEVEIGQQYIYKNGEKIITDTEAIIINDRTYLPIRAVMEAFGCQVDWVENGNKVFIDYETGILIKTVPSRYDMRDRGRVSIAKNQGDTGACWIFASIGSIESNLLPRERYDLSEDHLRYSHGYNLYDSDGGNFNIALSYYTSWRGPVLESDDPFNDGEVNEDAVTAKHIQEAILIPSKDYFEIKLSILLYGGVQSQIYIPPGIEEVTDGSYNITTSAFIYNGTKDVSHDVLIVGWDDDYPKESFINQPDNNGAFICKNSYGESFGEDGYFYISYEDVNIGTNNIVYSRVEDVTNYDHIYQSDMLGWVGRLGYGVSTAYFANVYEANSNEELAAASFYAVGDETSYEVYVVPDYETVADLKNATLLKRGTLDYAGYYTIDFDEAQEVGERFAVVVKVDTPNTDMPVASEYDVAADWMGNVDLSDGQGYISPDGQLWQSTEEILESNVCLKAFTNTID